MKDSTILSMALKRFFAYFIDVFILFIPITLVAYLGFGLVLTRLITIVVFWLYFALMESSKRQGTLGKNILKIKVVNEQGNVISFGKATIRHLGKILSGLIFLIGFIMMFFTKKQQCLHDLIAKTLVIKKDEYLIEDNEHKEISDPQKSTEKFNLTSKSKILMVLLLCLLIGSIISTTSALKANKTAKYHSARTSTTSAIKLSTGEYKLQNFSQAEVEMHKYKKIMYKKKVSMYSITAVILIISFFISLVIFLKLIRTKE